MCMWLSGKWESDTDLKATCKKDKVEILEYCKKVTTTSYYSTKCNFSHVVKIFEPKKWRIENGFQFLPELWSLQLKQATISKFCSSKMKRNLQVTTKYFVVDLEYCMAKKM